MKSVLKNLKVAAAALCLLGCMAGHAAYSDEMSDLNGMCASGDHMACHQRDIVRLTALCNNGDGHACRERNLIAFHDSCMKGDKGACVRFGVILGEDKERNAEWRHNHPELFVWWEK